MIPSYAYPGGKARIRDWVLDYCPKVGRNYGEMFAGRGNVFFAAAQNLNFQNWNLNDPRTERFFQAIKTVDLSLLPETVERKEYQKLVETKTPISWLLEPKITMLGKGFWQGGFCGSVPSRQSYHRDNYIPIVLESRRLFQITNTQISGIGYRDLSWWSTWIDQDFVYLDPPYDGSDSYYSPIDHDVLISKLQGAKFRWLLSNYITPRYLKAFGEPISTYSRNLEMDISGGNKSKRIEALWRNF